MDLKDKTILVTGAAGGIGQAIAIACARKGAIVLVNDRKNVEDSQQTLKEVKKYSKGYVFQADLADEGQVEKMFKDVSEKVSSVDVLVNNAGDARSGDFFDNTLWKYQFENIFFSALYTSQYFLRQNTRAQLRKIVNITSYYGNLGGGNPKSLAYSAAKAALSNMTMTLAKVDSRVLVNAIAPGYTWTPHWEGTSETEKKIRESRTIINRFITADEIAQAVIGVLENDAITGQIITVDGGLSLQNFDKK